MPSQYFCYIKHPRLPKDQHRLMLQALSDAHNFLFEERQRLLALQAENDDLKLQEVQDRKRIQQLLAMTQPYEQEMTYDKAAAPQTVTMQANSSAGQDGTTRIMRTVFLPTANTEVLTLKVESLQAQLNEQVSNHIAAQQTQALSASQQSLLQGHAPVYREADVCSYLLDASASFIPVTRAAVPLCDNLRCPSMDVRPYWRARRNIALAAATDWSAPL